MIIYYTCSIWEFTTLCICKSYGSIISSVWLCCTPWRSPAIPRTYGWVVSSGPNPQDNSTYRICIIATCWCSIQIHEWNRWSECYWYTFYCLDVAKFDTIGINEISNDIAYTYCTIYVRNNANYTPYHAWRLKVKPNVADFKNIGQITWLLSTMKFVQVWETVL